MHRLTLSILGVGLVVTACAFWIRSLDPVAGRGPIDAQTPAPSIDNHSGGEVLPVESGRSALETVPTAREYLADYWGDEWSRIEPAMIENGVDLDSPFLPTPWEDVAHEFDRMFELSAEWVEAFRSKRVDWPLELTPEWVVQAFPGALPEDRSLGPQELSEIQGLCSDLNASLYSEFETYVSTYDRALRDCKNQQRFVKAPFASYGVEPEGPGSAFYASSATTHGWCVSLRLFRDDYPGIDIAEQRMAQLRVERDILVRDYLKNL